MPHPATRLASERPASPADRSVRSAVEAGVIMETVEDASYDGRHVHLDGARLLNFGSCSYLGLEQRPELKEAAIRAIERYGTQFSFSRAYLQSPLYPRLEEALGGLTGGHVLVTPTTTLGHIAALPVLVRNADAVIVDQFAHASLHTAVALLHNPIVLIRHSRMDQLDEKIALAAKTHRRVWYVLDGLYSMRGDFAPIDRIAALLEAHPSLHLYIDDAHSTSWFGRNGRGYALHHLPNLDRVVVALSLNKAFSAGGGALVFPSDVDRLRVRRVGGPMLFSGPLQPPLLGAALASAELHMQTDFSELQVELWNRIERAHVLAARLGIRLSSPDRTPICFVRCGPADQTFALARALRDKGFYACVSIFPAVPQNQAGIRFTITLNNQTEDIDALMETMSFEMKRIGIVQRRGRSLAPAASVTDSGVMRSVKSPRSSRTSAPPP